MTKNVKLVAVVIAVFFGAILTIMSRSTKSDAHAFTAEHPSPTQAFRSVFNTTNQAGAVVADASHIASIWFSKELSDGENDLFVVFVQEQEIDSSGNPVDCHSCGVLIDSITYVRTQDGWASAKTQKHLSELGSWGKAPEVRAKKYSY